MYVIDLHRMGLMRVNPFPLKYQSNSIQVWGTCTLSVNLCIVDEFYYGMLSIFALRDIYTGICKSKIK